MLFIIVCYLNFIIQYSNAVRGDVVVSMRPQIYRFTISVSHVGCHCRARTRKLNQEAHTRCRTLIENVSDLLSREHSRGESLQHVIVRRATTRGGRVQ